MAQAVTTIVIDTREQRPYAFEGTDRHPVATVRRTLPAGDYSIEGHETRFAVERKSMSDYLRTVVHESRRFRAELQKLLTYDRAFIVVEFPWDAVLHGDYDRSDAIPPEAVVGITTGIMLGYGIPVLWAGDRPSARLLVERLCTTYARHAAASHSRLTSAPSSETKPGGDTVIL